MDAVGPYQGAAVVVNLCRDCAVCADDWRTHGSSHRHFVWSSECSSTARIVAIRLANIDTGATTGGERRDEECSCEWRDKRWRSLRRLATFGSGRAAELPSVWCATLGS